MNKLEDLCVSLETAKRLVEAGIEVDSLFSWFIYKDASILKFTYENKLEWDSIPAPTFEELDPPGLIFKDGVAYKLSIRLALNHWIVSYNNLCDQNDTLTDPEYNFTNEHSLVEVMAEILIDLKKQGLMENYKPERANVPSKFTLCRLKMAYRDLEQNEIISAKMELIVARDRAIDQKEVDDIKSVYDLLGKPQEAMKRIADILTRGGRIYDEYSEFLK